MIVSGVDESVVQESAPRELCLTLATLKATATASRLEPGPLVLGCDSVLEFEGEIYGKPADPEDAVGRWKRMRGRTGTLHTGHCLIDTASGRTVTEAAATTVRFGQLSDHEIARYVATGEPLRVAGGFTIDGLGGVFIDGVDGDPGTVIGLSLPLLRRMLRQLDISLVDFWVDRTKTGTDE